jgi:hypothetical protein
MELAEVLPVLIGEHLAATTCGDQGTVLAGVLTDRPPDALIQPSRLLARAARDHVALVATSREVVTERIADCAAD